MDDIFNDVQNIFVQGHNRVRRVSSWLYRDFTCTDSQLFTSLMSAFLGRDHVIGVALGLIIGAGFSNIVTSLVNDAMIALLSEVTLSRIKRYPFSASAMTSRDDLFTLKSESWRSVGKIQCETSDSGLLVGVIHQLGIVRRDQRSRACLHVETVCPNEVVSCTDRNVVPRRRRRIIR